MSMKEEKLIDIHSHILPFVDDGSPDIETSLKMLKVAQNIGIEKIILTPHLRGKYNADKKRLQSVFNELQIAKDKEKIEVQLFLGQEAFYTDKLLSKFDSGEALTLAGSKYVLLEFSYSNRTDVAEICYKFKRVGYMPIVAHIERYPYLTQEDYTEIKSVGGMIQINSSAIVGKDKQEIRTAKRLFALDCVDFVASDFHHFRENNMDMAVMPIVKRYGEDTAKQVFYENAKKILQ